MKKIQIVTIAAISGVMAFTQLQAEPVGEKAYVQLNTKCKGQVDGNSMIYKRIGKRIEHRRAVMMQIMKKLDLSAEQREKIKNIKKEHFMKMKKIRKVRKGEYHFGQFITRNGFDRSGFIMMSEKRAQVRAVNMAEHFEKMISVLTPEQRDKLKTVLNKERKNKL